MSASYLHTCLGLFEEVSKERYGWPFKLKAIEDDVRELSGSKKKISYQDLSYFTNAKHWWFDQFWVLPSQSQVDEKLEGRTFAFWQLSRGNEGSLKERQTIQALLDIFRSIELVSIILRFVRPESFGILSPPVEQVLSVRRGFNAVETYLHYLFDLRAIRDNYELPRAADADMALWVLHYKCFSSPPKDSALKHEFEKDPFMLHLRAKNLVAPLSELPLSRLAQALETVRDDLAGLVGCYAFERGIRERVKIENVKVEVKKKNGSKDVLDLKDLIDALLGLGKITTVEHGKWSRLRGLRNKVFHATTGWPTAVEIRDLVKTVLEIEQGNFQRLGGKGKVS